MLLRKFWLLFLVSTITFLEMLIGIAPLSALAKTDPTAQACLHAAGVVRTASLASARMVLRTAQHAKKSKTFIKDLVGARRQYAQALRQIKKTYTADRRNCLHPTITTAATQTSPTVPGTATNTIATTSTWTAGTQWVSIDGPNSTKIKAAITWPNGPGPFPVVVVLHGSDGFRQTYVSIAQQISQAGFITIAPCWFTGFKAPMGNFSDGIDCPNGPTFTGANFAAAAGVTAVVNYAQNLPGAKPNDVGIIGSSRGATAALLTASTSTLPALRAVVAVSAIYEYPKAGIADDFPIKYVDALSSPLLMLHSKVDQIVNVQEANDYDAALKKSGKNYESYYFDGAPHQMIFTPPYEDDVLTRATAFFKKYE